MKPNIVLILADDMGYGDFGVFNKGLSRTPILDWLVKEGVCLTQHYSGSPVCAPARASLMTGRYPHRTGAIDTLEGRGLDRLSLKERTIADALKSEGYATGLVGKWHLGALDPRYHPNSRGFDEFAGFRGGWQDYYQWRLDRNGSFQKADGRYLTDVFTEEAVSFIRRHSKEPFFLHVTYNAPHFPFQVPEEEHEYFVNKGKFTKGVSLIYAMIARMDRGIAQIIEELSKQGIEENTIVVFTSDNGPQFGGEGDMCTTRFNCGFNGSKGIVYEGGIRVPAIARWPAGLEKGMQVNEMVHFTDWFPTLLAAAGAKVPPDLKIDGWNVLPVLKGKKGRVNTKRFWQWNRYTPVITSNAAMRDGPWKLMRPVLHESFFVTREDGQMDMALKYEPEKFIDICRDPEPMRRIPPALPAQLYNIDIDPLERNDRAPSEPERVERMLNQLEDWFYEVEQDRKSIKDS
ncbi:hypothetical protein AUJ67_04845 [Candidatus Desantisbacteria bacterium CG1_02_49_89]|nr:MAG: hypothetical protein AUJ67_04845 [Candidatus Desantisbacteria bacterium CG1_02_49_89]PJB27834.1 MAG: arylsulfatase [Candidatus Desantisbacteria bacterium CG_4_9_14_3_um_filter_50_7]